MIKNNEDFINLEFELPGFDRKDIKIDIKENSISINAEKKIENKIQEETFVQQEKALIHFIILQI